MKEQVKQSQINLAKGTMGKSELAEGQEVIFSQYEKDSKNLSLYLRLYNTGQVRLDYYGNDLDSKNGLVKKTRGTILSSGLIIPRKPEEFMLMEKK